MSACGFGPLPLMKLCSVWASYEKTAAPATLLFLVCLDYQDHNLYMQPITYMEIEKMKN